MDWWNRKFQKKARIKKIENWKLKIKKEVKDGTHEIPKKCFR